MPIGANDSDKSNVQDIEQFELSVEYGSAFEAKPPVQHGCVHPAEVDGKFQGAVVQISKTGMCSEETFFEPPR